MEQHPQARALAQVLEMEAHMRHCTQNFGQSLHDRFHVFSEEKEEKEEKEGQNSDAATNSTRLHWEVKLEWDLKLQIC